MGMCLPLVAPAGLHERSIVAARIPDAKTGSAGTCVRRDELAPLARPLERRGPAEVVPEAEGDLRQLQPRSAESTIVNLMVQYPTTVDRAFAALADPTRRAVLERLGSGRATISELAEPFGMSLTGMKKHIRLLEEAQLVTTEKVGRVRRCMLAPYAFEGISTWLQRLDRFAQVVERTKGDR
jgi:DNA-binding transcriptional ArsR family regulator